MKCPKCTSSMNYVKPNPHYHCHCCGNKLIDSSYNEISVAALAEIITTWNLHLNNKPLGTLAEFLLEQLHIYPKEAHD